MAFCIPLFNDARVSLSLSLLTRLFSPLPLSSFQLTFVGAIVRAILSEKGKKKAKR